MAITPKVLSQHVPAAGGAFENAYTVPGATQTTIATVILHNTNGTTSDAGQLRVAIAGAANALSQEVFNVNVPADGTVVLTTGITVQATDVVRVASANGTLNFHLYGIEES
jgi:hypothetical protein